MGMLALDIETGNYSHDIGGFRNTYLFEPTVVATWDGDNGTIYCNKSVDNLPTNVILKKLHPKTLGEDLRTHIEKGDVILGHNLTLFDLPILRDSLDCMEAGEVLSKSKENIFDTSIVLRSVIGHAIPLSDTVKHTLGKGKLMESTQAPLQWRLGQYEKVAKYCLEDARLVYDLWAHGKSEGFVKARCRETGAVTQYEVEW
tara:strand:+ start:1068 stop:1670 length:603 start_codon:yes stop_codon:yes gene_type:complete